LIYNGLIIIIVGMRSYVLIYISDYQCYMFIQLKSVFNFLHTPIFDMKPPIWIQMDMFYGHVQKYLKYWTFVIDSLSFFGILFKTAKWYVIVGVFVEGSYTRRIK
jgi:hypothetical protein